MQTVRLSLLIQKGPRRGETHARAGINWGQRNNRDRNQAYLHIPPEHRDFFPPRGERFTVMADDGKRMVMVVAQDAGKALHTPENNSILGGYLRKRMGLRSGIYVTREHLDHYGRTDVEFCRVGPKLYHLDFSPPDGR